MRPLNEMTRDPALVDIGKRLARVMDEREAEGDERAMLIEGALLFAIVGTRIDRGDGALIDWLRSTATWLEMIGLDRRRPGGGVKV